MKIALFCSGDTGVVAIEAIDACLNVSDLLVITSTRMPNIPSKLRVNTEMLIFDGSFAQIQERLKKTKYDLVVSSAFGSLIPASVYELARHGGINIHASLLPKYRGRHPLNWALINDELETGVSIHKLSSRFDEGEIFLQKRFLIDDNDNINTIRATALNIGAQLLKQIIRLIDSTGGLPESFKQDPKEASYAPLRKPEDGNISWSDSTRKIFSKIRALLPPYPGAYCLRNNGQKVTFKNYYIHKQPGQVILKHQNYHLISSRDGVILVEADCDLAIGENLLDG
ncbi:hypothetical protein JNK13_08780 [bacterium]|nr:hypothetical protein [bacterium]